MKRRRYVVEKRYDYHTVEEYEGNMNTKTIMTGLAKKRAEVIAEVMNDAVWTFIATNGLDSIEG